jgi:hypothetical protein
VNSFLASIGFKVGDVAVRDAVAVAGQPGSSTGEGQFRTSDPSQPPTWMAETITLAAGGNSFTINPATYPDWTRIGT